MLSNPPSHLENFLAQLTMNPSLEDNFNGMVYHYTSSFGFRSILFKNENHITLWASRYDCLNDMKEGKSTLAMYQAVCSKMLQEDKLTKELYDFFIFINPSRTIYLPYEKKGHVWGTRLECDHYVCSFSKNNDALTMWNYYSKGQMYEGFNIGFDSMDLKDQLYFNKPNCTRYVVSPVVYDTHEQESIIRKMLDQLIVSYTKKDEVVIREVVANRLEELSLLFKSPYFKHEEEVRLIVSIPKKQKVKIFDIHYRNSHGYIIPYIELKVDKSTVLKASLGPLNCSEEQKVIQKQILEEQLQNAMFLHASAIYSHIPIRY